MSTQTLKEISSVLKPLKALGADKTEKAIEDLSSRLSHSSFFIANEINEYKNHFLSISKSLSNYGWNDDNIAALLNQVFTLDCLSKIKQFRFDDFLRYINAHENDPDKVITCLSVDPPSGYKIIRLFSDAGSQKLVFLASSEKYQRKVILKIIKKGKGSNSDDIIGRESIAHPMHIKNEHIIQTYVEKNELGEGFLIENRMPRVLNDEWRSEGIHEASNLLYHMALAIKCIQEQGLVHGDIKPDNIGRDIDCYVLMDFGLCRKASKIKEEQISFGSLRTRAPELLCREKIVDPLKIDIWSLGATIFNTYVGRFPLYEHSGEKPPRSSKPEERTEFERVLLNRIDNDWNKLVNVDGIDNIPLKEILGLMLKRNPIERIGIEELLRIIPAKLSAYLRIDSNKDGLSPMEQIEQIVKFLPKDYDYTIVPDSIKDTLKKTLDAKFDFLDDGLKGKVERLKQLIK